MNVPASLRLGACAATVLLIALVARWTLIAPTPPRIFAGVVLAGPLAVGLPYAWMTLALAPSLVFGLTEVVANPAMRRWAGLVLFDVVAAFALLLAYLRATRSSSPP